MHNIKRLPPHQKCLFFLWSFLISYQIGPFSITTYAWQKLNIGNIHTLSFERLWRPLTWTLAMLGELIRYRDLATQQRTHPSLRQANLCVKHSCHKIRRILETTELARSDLCMPCFIAVSRPQDGSLSSVTPGWRSLQPSK